MSSRTKCLSYLKQLNSRDSNPRVEKFDGCAPEVTLVTGRQNVIVLQSNCTNRGIREMDAIECPLWPLWPSSANVNGCQGERDALQHRLHRQSQRT
jgi:hypothetical protein